MFGRGGSRRNAAGPTPVEGKVGVLGVGVSPVNMRRALERIQAWIDHGESHYVCVAAAHSLMACRQDPELRAIFNRSGMTTPDGMPLVWTLRLRGHREVSRVYGPDLLLAAADGFRRSGVRHFFYGGAPGVADDLGKALEARYPGMAIAGSISPPFHELAPSEDREIAARIRRSSADIVWVGLGTGKQERWMADHVGRVGAPVLISVGAAFDFLSGRKRQAPRWLRQSGFEWLFRLVTEPRRLWRRYVHYPKFALLLAAEWSGLYRVPYEEK